jgi:hypothetical protein
MFSWYSLCREVVRWHALHTFWPVECNPANTSHEALQWIKPNVLLPKVFVTQILHLFVLSTSQVGPVIQGAPRPFRDRSLCRQIIHDTVSRPLCKKLQINNKVMLCVILLGIMAPLLGCSPNLSCPLFVEIADRDKRCCDEASRFGRGHPLFEIPQTHSNWYIRCIQAVVPREIRLLGERSRLSIR